jgi:hypothetical protein
MVSTESLAMGPAMRWLALALSSVFVFAVVLITAGDALFRRLQRRALQRSLDKVEWHKFMGVAVLLLLSSCLARSAPITGLTQTWKYDPETRKGTVHFENVSHKNIVAFDVGVYVTYKDGHLFVSNESLHDLVYQHGVVFAPGQTHDEEVSGPTQMEGVDLTNPNNVRAEVDVVVYEDDTAEVNNQQAFESILENRQAAVEAAKKINEVVQQVLDDPTVTDQHTAIIGKLQQLAVVAKKQEQFMLSSFLDVRGNEVPRDKENLPAYVKRNDQRIAELEPHTNVKVIEGVQP